MAIHNKILLARALPILPEVTSCLTGISRMRFLPAGAVLIDTPGMRELQLSDGKDGIRRTFADIDVLAEQCCFKDCQHKGEPGCAVEQALNSGELDPRRLANYHKLQAELRRNTSSLPERRAKDREFGMMIKRLAPVIRHNKKGINFR